MPWYIYALAAIIIMGSGDIVRKSLLSGKNKLDYYTAAFIYATGTFIGLLAYGVFVNFEMPPIQDIWLLMIINLSMGIIGWLTSNKGLSMVEAGEYNILLSTRLIWTFIVSIVFLDIGLSLSQFIGVLLIVLALFVIYFHKKELKKSSRQGMFWVLLTSAIWGNAIIVDQLIYRQADVASYLTLGFGITALVLAMIRPKVIPQLKLFVAPKQALPIWVAGLSVALGLPLMFYSS